MSKPQKPTAERQILDTTLFDDLIGEDFVQFLFKHAPTKVRARLEKALIHYIGAYRLNGIDDEMGAIRLIAAEEELVVAIFEWLKLNDDKFPEHRDFVGKFKNHVVKLSVYPVIAQFRFILGDILKSFSPEGLDFIDWNAKPIIDGASIKLGVYDKNGKEIIRHTPLAIMISQGDLHGNEVIPSLLNELEENIQSQRNISLRNFLLERADFRNRLLYASDGGSVLMAETLEELIVMFKQTFHDLLWVLVILIGAEIPSKEWGLVSQFIGLYRQVLIKAGALKNDNTVTEAVSELA